MNQTTHQKPNWTAVITFYVIACAFSWPFFAWRDLYPESWKDSEIPGELRNLGVIWGPGIAAIICFILFRKSHKRTITFAGTSLLKSLLFYFLPYAVWLVIILINPDEKSIKPGFFLQLIPFGFLMILGEELGWRGFLQDELRPLKKWKRWLLLGVMWEMWHFTRGITEGEWYQIFVRKTVMLVSVLALTYIIGKLTDKTRSLLIAITLHSWVNIQFEFQHINTHIAFGISILIWATLIFTWNRKKEIESGPEIENTITA